MKDKKPRGMRTIRITNRDASRAAINRGLESTNKLAKKDNPIALKRTSRSYKTIISTIEGHYNSLDDQIANENVLNAKRVPASKSKEAELIKNFVGFLSQHGQVSITKNAEQEIKNSGIATGEGKGYRLGIFLDNNLLGFLDLYDNEVWYQGHIPSAALSEEDTKKLEKRHALRSWLPNQKTSSDPFVRLIYVLIKEGQDLYRNDGWDIPFIGDSNKKP